MIMAYLSIIHLNFSWQVLKDAELSQGPEKAAQRRKTVADSESVYDLLTVALVRRAQYGVLAEVGHIPSKQFDSFLHEALTLMYPACLLSRLFAVPYQFIVWPLTVFCFVGLIGSTPFPGPLFLPSGERRGEKRPWEWGCLNSEPNPAKLEHASGNRPKPASQSLGIDDRAGFLYETTRLWERNSGW